MYFRPAFLSFLALLFTAGSGCQKSQSVAPVAPPTALSPDTTASIHWFGKKRIGITFGAYYFARIWQQPQSAQLERQTLLKLATTPGLWLPGATNLTTDARSRLFWVLSDILQEEGYLEIRQPEKENGEAVFAIRLNQAHNDQWLTNLPVILEPLTAGNAVFNPQQNGWLLKTTNTFQFIKLSSVGDWTLVAAGPEQNPLAAEITDRIRRDGVPFISAGTNLWLEASLDFQRRKKIFPLSALMASPPRTEGRGEMDNFFSLNSQLSTLNFSVTGDGANVITRGKLTFTNPFAEPLEPWRLPVDLMHEPLTSFTAVRGLPSLLTDRQPWRDLEIGAAPNQFCFWSLAGSPYQIYLAAPLPDASSQVAALSDYLLQKSNPWLATNGYISFDRATNGNGVTWGNLPDIKPFIKSFGTGTDGWLFAGLLLDTNTDVTPPPTGLIQDVLRRTNLIYYDWEVTGSRLQPVLQLGQTARQITRRPEMALDSASLTWLGQLIPRLGTSATIATRTGPAELTFYRRSNLGFNAVELHVLADWLESPDFPRSLHSW